MEPAKVRVLVVDDEEPILRIVRIQLRQAGYEAITAPNGRQALELVQASRPAVMVLDIFMPGMDGFQVLEALGLPPPFPVIVFSARMDNAQKAFSLGAAAFIPKPFGMDDIVRQVRKVLENPAANPKPA